MPDAFLVRYADPYPYENMTTPSGRCPKPQRSEDCLFPVAGFPITQQNLLSKGAQHRKAAMPLTM